MVRTILVLLAAFLFGTALAQRGLATSPVGTWKYDIATLHLELNDAGKKELNDPKHGNQSREKMAQLKANLAKTLKTMTITFKADHKVVVTSTMFQDKLLGTWTMNGLQIKVLMTNVKQQTPDMAIAKDGKHIVATYTDPRFGVGKVTLVRS
ncbi:MAG TPA: hypothetical protein VHE55_14705 [Fimbriimonadaceae bacterium]|nr:hypothetical protein [Fimbriimonadaceae bacterium]